MSRPILVDTCAVIKWANGSMPPSARTIFLTAPRRFVSVLSAWEVQLKPDLRSRMSAGEFENLIGLMNLESIPLELDHIRALAAIYALPHLPHKDPFDHLLIATALLRGLPILTCDEHFKQYPKLEVLW